MGVQKEAMTTIRLTSIMTTSSAQAISAILQVLYPDAVLALDLTYGNGRFWDGSWNGSVIGADIDPARAKHAVMDFREVELPDASVDVVIFDPPFLSDVSKKRTSIIGNRFGHYATLPSCAPRCSRVAVKPGACLGSG
jgi:hypothetical protein